LFELYTEEIPSFYQIRAISDWREKLVLQLQDNLLECSSVETGGTSRRIYAIVHNLKPNQISGRKKIKGPPQELCQKDGKPTSALLGFAKKTGIGAEEANFEMWDGKMYATAEINIGGKAIQDVFPGIFENLVKTQFFPRSMRWGSSSMTYARPVIQYFAMYGSSILKFTSGIWEFISASQRPIGHFILGPEKVEFENASQYVAAMEKAGILVHPEIRREKIKKMLIEYASNESVVMNNKLLDEVNFLVEKPVVIRGSFSREFLEMPGIVILSEMEEHQKYFGLLQTAGSADSLSNEFLVVANGDSKDTEAMGNIRRGNEKVLRARLADGSYFFREDRKKKLIEREGDLKRMVFHEGLGTLYDKKERIKEIAKILSKYIYSDVNPAKMIRACDLMKADLTTHLVYEFDHLQGEIGSVYAALDGEDEEVCNSIREHYLPRNENDNPPQSKMGLLLSFADKLDNILSGFILGKQPTSSQDPLGLRRQTLYIIEMMIHNKINLSTTGLTQQLLAIYGSFKVNNTNILKEIQEFFSGRLATIFEKEGFDRKLINAALDARSDRIYEMFLKLDSLRAMKEDENFISMMSAFKRMNNIVQDYCAKNDDAIPVLNEKLFELAQEKRLYEISQEIKNKTKKISGVDRQEYEDVFVYLASVKSDVDNFFDRVMVMHEKKDIKMNRLAILNQAVQSVKDLINIGMLY